MPLLFAILYILAGGPSFGIYTIKKSYTVPGLILISLIAFVFLLLTIKFAKYLILKFGKKLK